MSAGVIISLVVSIILLFTSMVLSALSANSLNNKDYKTAHTAATASAVTCGIAVILLVIVMIIYIRATEYHKEVLGKIGEATSQYIKAPNFLPNDQ